MTETTRRSQRSVSADTRTRRIERALGRVALFGGPLVLFVASLWHPETGHHGPGAAFVPVADRYLAVHLLLVPAGPLLAAGLYSLVARARGGLALVARLVTGVFGFLITVYTSIAGLAVGILATEAPAGTEQATVAALVDSLFVTPLPILLAVLTIGSYLVAVVLIASSLRRRGAPLLPLLALVGSTVAIYNHLGLTGVVGTGLYLLAVVWLEFGWTPERTHSRAGRSAGS